jgi:hypothetical protein
MFVKYTPSTILRMIIQKQKTSMTIALFATI